MTKYLVWCRKRNQSDALWTDLPYGPRYRDDAESLIDYYQSEWGNIYEYEICRVGTYPSGLREPCFVGHM